MNHQSAFTTKRNVSLDLLRICAAIMVVMAHVAAYSWYSRNPSSPEWIAMNLYNSMNRSSVTLFFMLSGAFLLKKDIPLKNLYLHKILPLVVIYVVWSFLYAVDKIGIGGLKTAGIAQIVTMTVNSHYHLWFIPTLIGLYMLQPVLCAIVHYNNGAHVKYMLILFVIFGIIRPTVLLFTTNASAARLIETIPVELTSYSGYMILGYYFVHMENRKRNPWIMLAGFAAAVSVCAAVCQIDAINTGKPSSILYGATTVTTFMAAIFLFLCFYNIPLRCCGKVQLLIQQMSSLTFGVYLFHPFVLDQLNTKLHLTSTSYNTFAAVPVNTLIIVSICFLVTLIMTKIPILKRVWKS